MSDYIEYGQSIVDSVYDITGIPATESLATIKKTLVANSSKLAKTIVDTSIELIETLAANLIVLSNNLSGYKVSVDSIELLDKLIDLFDDITKNCTHNLQTVFRGFTADDLEAGVTVFNPESLSNKINNQNLIKAGAILLAKHKDLAAQGIKEEYASYDETVRIQKRMVHTANEILKMGKVTKISFTARVKAEQLGMGSYIDTALAYNKAEIAQIGSMLISAFGNLYVKPQKDLSEVSPETAEKLTNLSSNMDLVVKYANKIV